MNKAEPVRFKCEDSLWQMLASGEKMWDARRWDMADERIRRLAAGKWFKTPPAVLPYWLPVEPFVDFENKATGQVLRRRLLGLEFAAWAPGWVFIILCGIVEIRTG